MCGIAGVLDFNNRNRMTAEETARFVNPLQFRGPDHEQHDRIESADVYVWFAHRRLSIIDLTDAGNQPMTSSSTQSIIVFNGEIYNYKELRKELLSAGCAFRTHSDTEVILNGFERWGIEALLQRLDGMFSFALFDKKERKLYLARDRFGKKPLYYSIDGKRLTFSSDIRSFSAQTTPLNIDLHALGYFFTELTTPHEATIWKQVKKLKPASYLLFDLSGIRTYQSYWQLKYTEDCNLTRNEIIEKSEYLLGEAVKKRLVADVNVSAMLSGGIDSSLVVAKMAALSSHRIKTYSVGFNEKAFNELPYARLVADKFNTEHSELHLASFGFEDVNNLIVEFGEPFADSSMIPTYLISKEIAKNEKVVLGGDGGDELFAGYHSYYAAHKFDKVKRYGWLHPIAAYLSRLYPSYRTAFLKKLLQQSKHSKASLLNRNLGFLKEELHHIFDDVTFISALENEHAYIWKHFTPSSQNDLINVLSASLKTRLLNDYLVKVDRASMYASLEMRSPFLDKALAEFAATLKPDQLFYKNEPKSVLKEIAVKSFSKDFTHRNKMGFAIPIGEWFKGNFRKNVKEVVLGGKQRLVDFNYPYIERIIDEHINGIADHTHKIWSMYVFHIWAKNQ